MNKLYLFPIFFIFILFNSCSKDILKPFEDRVIGQWRISDVNRLGIGGSASELRFTEGQFIFNEDGTLEYTDVNGVTFNGSWDIQKRMIDGNYLRTLQLTAVDFNTQRVISEYYDDMNFRGTNHFVAKITAPTRTFITHFRR